MIIFFLLRVSSLVCTEHKLIIKKNVKKKTLKNQRQQERDLRVDLVLLPDYIYQLEERKANTDITQ